jgi:hypothetical protein
MALAQEDFDWALKHSVFKGVIARLMGSMEMAFMEYSPSLSCLTQQIVQIGSMRVEKWKF